MTTNLRKRNGSVCPAESSARDFPHADKRIRLTHVDEDEGRVIEGTMLGRRHGLSLSPFQSSVELCTLNSTASPGLSIFPSSSMLSSCSSPVTQCTSTACEGDDSTEISASSERQPSCDLEFYLDNRSPGTDGSLFQDRNKISKWEKIPYAVCLGMISTKILDRHPPSEKQSLIPIQMKFDNDIAWLKTSKGDHLGLIGTQVSSALGLLRSNYPVSLDAFVTVTQVKASKKLPEYANDNWVYIIVYGSKDHRDDIGRYLSDHQLYLQHPLTYDTSTDYDNPHYFMPPGETLELPNIINLSLVGGQEPSVGFLDQALEIFEGNSRIEGYHSQELKLPSGLKTKLKDHQKVGLDFMAEKESGQVEGNQFGCFWEVMHSNNQQYNIQTAKPSIPLGGLIADSMGLGKTLTALTLIAIDIASAQATHVRHSPTLIVAPPSALIAWEFQIAHHFEKGTFRVSVYHGERRQRNIELLSLHDIVLTTYDTLVADRSNKKNECLYKIVWRRVILDEAHFIKDKSTKRFKAAMALESRLRWCLTGTPIQNRIDDFAAILSFLRIHPFDRSFKKLIIDPLQKANSAGVRKLRLLVQSISLRRSKEFVELPPRTDHVEKVEFSEDERMLNEFARQQAKEMLWESTTGSEYQSILQVILRLRQICNHNCDLWPPKLRKQFQESHRASQRLGHAFFDTLDSCEGCGGDINEDPAPDFVAACPHILCGTCATGTKAIRVRGSTARKGIRSACPLCFTGDIDLQDTDDRTSKRRPENWKSSSKVTALIKNLRKDRCSQDGSLQKSVVFSCWTGMLDLVEIALDFEGIQFQRIDGRMPLKKRSVALQKFRSNSNCQVLLASVMCAGVGIDLTAASRVHLLEPQWNPSTEEQALDRVHRMGQDRPVITYRYIVQRSMDENIVALQQKKLQLVKLSFGGEGSGSQDLEVGSTLSSPKQHYGVDLMNSRH